MKKPLILIGGGGHCKSCIDVIEMEGQYRIEGILDHKDKVGEKVLSYSINGEDGDMALYIEKGYSFLITVGHIKTSSLRKRLFDQLKHNNAHLATIISPHATVSPHSSIGEGSIVMHGVIINAGVTIGENVILNSNCLIEHDANVGNHVHVSTGALVNGNCIIGNDTFIGSGAVIANNVSISSQAIIGAGSLVLKDVEAAGIYAVVPIKKIKDT